MHACKNSMESNAFHLSKDTLVSQTYWRSLPVTAQAKRLLFDNGRPFEFSLHVKVKPV